jgi:acetolactate synthase-1/2/3 large subunit
VQIERAISMLEAAERPVVISGSGILWSGAAAAMTKWIEKTGMPFFTTPQGRGVVPEDHRFAFPNARSAALREADLVLVLGTRLNYVFSHGKPPRFGKDARLIRIDIDPGEIAASPQVALGICADVRVALEQLSAATTGRIAADRYATWTSRLAGIDAEKAPTSETALGTDQVPIHPLRLCREIRDFLPRDAILCVDGQEILNYGRQVIPTHTPGHRLNSGTFGTMGVGLPFGLGAKAAKPDKLVLVLHGDGSFGMNGLELDTAVRHNLPVITVISLNGGWTADPKGEKPGRDLGYTRFDEMAKALGCHGEYVESPEQIRPALDRAAQAVAAGKPAVVNVVTDPKARAQTVRFSASST